MGSSQRQQRPARSFPALDEASLALIKANGYDLSPDLKQRSWPRNIAKAQKDGRDFALKLVGRKERDFLKILQSHESYENHVVKLIDVIHGNDDIIIVVMPWLSALGNRFSGPNASPSVKSSLITQFLWGVRFLHEHGIAHLDLKPGNVLVKYLDGSPVPHLSIIDFGVSVRVQDQETTVTGFRGTPYWTAPEVGAENGPDMTYSAIRADRWSCGRMLDHFGANGALFSAVRQKLLDPDPNCQPSLNDVLRMLKGKRSIDKDTGCVSQKLARNTVLNLNIADL